MVCCFDIGHRMNHRALVHCIFCAWFIVASTAHEHRMVDASHTHTQIIIYHVQRCKPLTRSIRLFQHQLERAHLAHHHSTTITTHVPPVYPPTLPYHHPTYPTQLLHPPPPSTPQSVLPPLLPTPVKLLFAYIVRSRRPSHHLSVFLPIDTRGRLGSSCATHATSHA
ncbi:hypothetical protein HDK90DRAFT_128866 [Phyllosticta capitalensis]|uniref:Secreted protein n=1 Tax=Phyllosticta capitalensis TaxID=121624 RepID=A0ABR1YYE0_9PEZI